MYHGAAQSFLDYKQGNWLFSYQLDDLEVHTATFPTEDRDFSLDWCLDSGASCHFCNDSTKIYVDEKMQYLRLHGEEGGKFSRQQASVIVRLQL